VRDEVHARRVSNLILICFSAGLFHHHGRLVSSGRISGTKSVPISWLKIGSFMQLERIRDAGIGAGQGSPERA